MPTEHIKGVLKHKQDVGEYMARFANELFKRAVIHDFSKFSEEEFYAFESATPKLKNLTYGSDEYKQQLELIKPAIQHHYKVNSHHPEHYSKGVKGMSLMDIVEMLCDWMGAVKRHNDGNILKSIKINKERFGYSDELYEIFLNTIKKMYKYCIEWGCCDGREGLYIGDTIEEIHKRIDKDSITSDAEKEDLKYGFFREFKDKDYETKNICWDNAFDVSWTKNF